MARITDANELFAGPEPKFSPLAEITSAEIGKALNWYSQNKAAKDAQKYATDYFKKKLKITNVEESIKTAGSTFGWICRIVSNGGILAAKEQKWFEDQIAIVKENKKKKKVVVKVKDDVPKVTIQDRIAEKASDCIAELEGQVDDFYSSKFSSMPQPYAMMHTKQIKGVHTRFIVDWAKKHRNEFDEVLNTDDKDLKEGYSNFKRTELKKMVNYFDQVILDCSKVNEAANVGRKPRKRKEKSPEQLVAKVKVCSEFKDLGLKSIDVKTILGATQLWVYNTKYRKVGCYHAADAGGFSIKGTTILNFNETKSIQKKLRKPEASLPEILNGGKVTLRNFMDGIRAVESPMNGRLNADIILLRVMK